MASELEMFYHLSQFLLRSMYFHKFTYGRQSLTMIPDLMIKIESMKNEIKALKEGNQFCLESMVHRIIIQTHPMELIQIKLQRNQRYRWRTSRQPNLRRLMPLRRREVTGSSVHTVDCPGQTNLSNPDVLTVRNLAVWKMERSLGCVFGTRLILCGQAHNILLWPHRSNLPNTPKLCITIISKMRNIWSR